MNCFSTVIQRTAFSWESVGRMQQVNHRQLASCTVTRISDWGVVWICAVPAACTGVKAARFADM